MKRFNTGYIYIILCAAIFSFVEVALKSTAGMFHPLQITVLRFLIGGVVLLPLALRSVRKHGTALSARDLGFFAALGFLFVCVAMTVYQLALTFTQASVVAVLFSSNPLFITILAHLLLREDIRKNHIVALCLEIVAIFIIVDPLHASLSPAGCALAVASSILFSLYSVLGKRQTPRVGGIAVTSLCSLFGGAELLLLLLFGKTAAGAALFTSLGLPLFADVPVFSGLTAASVPWLLYLGVVNTLGGFGFHMLAMEKTNAQTASIVYFLKPMLSPLIALAVLHESIRLNMWLGILCFLVGSGFAILPGVIEGARRQRAEPRPR